MLLLGASEPHLIRPFTVVEFYFLRYNDQALLIGLSPSGRSRSRMFGPGFMQQTVRLPFASAQRLDYAGKVIPILRSMCLTMPANVLNDRIFNHPGPLRVLRASRCVDTVAAVFAL